MFSFFRSLRSAKPSIRPSFRPGIEFLETRIAPATFTVNLATDTNVAFGITGGKLDLGGVQSGAASGDLRWCLSQANMTPGADDVVFNLPANSTIALNQLLMIYDTCTIHGETAVDLTLSGQTLHRVLYVNNGTVNINDLTIANGLADGGAGGNGDGATGGGAGGGGAGLGGGLLINSGNVTLSSVSFVNNQAVGGAGGDSTGVGDVGGGGGAGGNGGVLGPMGAASGGGGFLGNGGGAMTVGATAAGGGGGGGVTRGRR